MVSTHWSPTCDTLMHNRDGIVRPLVHLRGYYYTNHLMGLPGAVATPTVTLTVTPTPAHICRPTNTDGPESSLEMRTMMLKVILSQECKSTNFT